MEEVVLLDEDGNAIGTAPKAEVHGTDTPLHLAFSCYVFDGAGRLLVTQRALAKPTFGGVWTNSCCGHPAPGEPIDEAVRRRTGQELGLELDGVTLVLPRFRYRAVMDNGTVENELCPVFMATRVRRPAPRPGRGGGLGVGAVAAVPRRRPASATRGQPLVPGAGGGAPGGPAVRSGGRPCPATPGSLGPPPDPDRMKGWTPRRTP